MVLLRVSLCAPGIDERAFKCEECTFTEAILVNEKHSAR